MMAKQKQSNWASQLRQLRLKGLPLASSCCVSVLGTSSIFLTVLQQFPRTPEKVVCPLAKNNNNKNNNRACERTHRRKPISPGPKPSDS